jgi:UDP-N-acetylglucosamine 3-dehydrogenase
MGSVRGVALLGCGEVAGLHSRTLARVAPGVDRYYASRDVDRARDFAARHRGAGAFDGYEAALSDPRVDVVLVLTPPRHHLEWTLAALEAGKHVIVEKPAFLRVQEFERVQAAARVSTGQVLVAENYHYRPLAGALRDLLAHGALGELLFLHVDAVKTQEVSGWRDDGGLSGGGALMEGGIHWVSFLAHLGPEVESVHAVRPRPGPGPERSMALLFRYQGGGAASLHYSWEVPSPLKGLRLSRAYGTEGAATFESNGLFLALRGRRWRFRFPGLRDIRGYEAMFRDFLGALGSGRPADFRLEDARRDVELVEEAYASAGVGPAG